MTYDYKCSHCGNVTEVFISTTTILHRGVIIDKEELQKKINEEKFCVCGGKLKRIYSAIPLDSIWFANSGYVVNGSTHRILQRGGTSGFNSKLRS